MQQKKIPINKPSITDLEVSYVNDAIKNGWGEKCYDYINRFERDFARFIGTNHGLATSSCTGAIHLALMAMGIKSGDEVMVPEITWIASVEPVLYIGAKPVFIDVQKDSWCIDPVKIREAITPKTKAIIVVHVYGNMCDMDAIMDIASEYDLKVLEDAAESLGSEYKGHKAGSIGHAGVFSFHGTKTMTTGEGGILVTNNIEVYERAKVLNDHGRNPRDPENKMFWMRNYGYKYKMSNLQAAIGCAQIERLDSLIDRKIEIFNRYKQLLADLPLEWNPEPKDTINSYWMPTIILDKFIKITRDEIFAAFKENNIDIRPFFFPLSSLPMFTLAMNNIVSFDIFERGINLPSFHDITEQEILRVANILREQIEPHIQIV